MSIFYSQSSGGFYPAEMRSSYEAAGSWPDDGVEITQKKHAELLAGIAAGKCIKCDSKGWPSLIAPPGPSDEQVAASMREARDTAIHATDWLLLRHQDETLQERAPTLSKEQLAALLAYRQALRDLSEAPDWPKTPLPAVPDLLTISTEFEQSQN